jgi:hypothetical protein
MSRTSNEPKRARVATREAFAPGGSSFSLACASIRSASSLFSDALDIFSKPNDMLCGISTPMLKRFRALNERNPQPRIWVAPRRLRTRQPRPRSRESILRACLFCERSSVLSNPLLPRIDTSAPGFIASLNGSYLPQTMTFRLPRRYPRARLPRLTSHAQREIRRCCSGCHDRRPAVCGGRHHLHPRQGVERQQK